MTSEEKATQIVWLTPRTKARLERIRGRDMYDHTRDEVLNKFMDVYEREKMMEE
jgi:hypothetical protein